MPRKVIKSSWKNNVFLHFILPVNLRRSPDHLGLMLGEGADVQTEGGIKLGLKNRKANTAGAEHFILPVT